MRRSSQIRFISSQPGQGYNGGGLLARIVALIVGTLFFGLAVFVGAVFLAALVGLVLIGAVIVMSRIWWIKRKMEQYERESGDLKGEYTVIKEEDRRQ